ncbi:MAG: helix-turn-helix transcriptional regulator [Bacteroidia bacterium]|nr:helix-turn-helix transcriptional regulator [Bacteroidia bacterium]
MTQHGYCIQLLDCNGLQTSMHTGEAKGGETLWEVMKLCLGNENVKRKLRDSVVKSFIACLYMKKDGVYYLQELPDVRPPAAWKLKAKEAGLTNTQINVLEKTGQGYSSREIAEMMCRSVNTIKKHKRDIRLKMGVRNMTSVFRALGMLPAENTPK